MPFSKQADQNFDVFLGGSCNPTTWRRKIAIPFLESEGITYYNPQVDYWKPEMVQLERLAKQNARLLFFVIDVQTRSTVGLIESAFIAGEKLNLILVMSPFNHFFPCIDPSNSPENIEINGERISFSEYKELNKARNLLKNLVISKQIPFFVDIHSALDFAKSCIGDKVFLDKYNDFQKDKLSTNIQSHSEEFTVSNMLNTSPLSLSPAATISFDVYISFDDEENSSCRESTLDYLREANLTYKYGAHFDDVTYNKDLMNMSDDSHYDFLQSLKNYKRVEDNDSILNGVSHVPDKKIASAMREAGVLLFIISNRCRGLSMMVLAAYCMSLNLNNMVLCLQYLQEPCCIKKETLSKAAVADYNRGRLYLYDHAQKAQVPIFSDIQEAVKCCSKKCRYNK